MPTTATPRQDERLRGERLRPVSKFLPCCFVLYFAFFGRSVLPLTTLERCLGDIAPVLFFCCGLVTNYRRRLGDVASAFSKLLLLLTRSGLSGFCPNKA